MIKTNYHTHNKLCRHAVGNIEDYVLKAIELNYSELGLTDHMPMIEEIESQVNTRRMSFDEYYNQYLPEMDDVIKKYSSKIKIYRGLEVEYLEAMLDKINMFHDQLDYLILGQHYIYYDNQYISVYSNLKEEHLKCYESTVIKAMKSGLFKILAHPDLYLWSVRVWNDTCEEIALNIIKAAIECDVVLEINANGIRNCIIRDKFTTHCENGNIVRYYSYPNYYFFKLAKDLGAKIIVNEDVHDPLFLSDSATKEAFKLAKELKIDLIKRINFEK